jgi:hypothetical protein
MARLGRQTTVNNGCDCGCSDVSVDEGSENSFHPRMGNANLGILRYDFTIQKGTDLRVPLYLIDGAQNPINLTGYSAKCKIRKEVDSNPIDSLSTQNRRILIDTEKSTITLLFPKSVTENYKIETVNNRRLSELGNVFLYDVYITSSGGEVSCILKGTVRIVPQISR